MSKGYDKAWRKSVPGAFPVATQVNAASTLTAGAGHDLKPHGLVHGRMESEIRRPEEEATLSALQI